MRGNLEGLPRPALASGHLVTAATIAEYRGTSPLTIVGVASKKVYPALASGHLNDSNFSTGTIYPLRHCEGSLKEGLPPPCLQHPGHLNGSRHNSFSTEVRVTPPLIVRVTKEGLPHLASGHLNDSRYNSFIIETIVLVANQLATARPVQKGMYYYLWMDLELHRYYMGSRVPAYTYPAATRLRVLLVLPRGSQYSY
ncbi:hypothetical protein AVEN_212974-1 [Araneus ventricosus]|uniref:Uncharacterized protein n=1 Tax=Araneus ventricosus TaxID=182803 RepID=A0A4Y2MEP8_ARAVE|nr:hypothetical protein AVEN_212974-1 [Araneus ventricosus]